MSGDIDSMIDQVGERFASWFIFRPARNRPETDFRWVIDVRGLGKNRGFWRQIYGDSLADVLRQAIECEEEAKP